MGLRTKKILAGIRRRWGRSRSESFHSLTAAYAGINPDDCRHQLSAQTLSDIDFIALFEFLDHTNSRIGQQVLYDRLTKPSEDVQSRQQLDVRVRWLTANPTQREAAQLLLHKLDHPDARQVCRLIEDKPHPRPRWLRLARVDTALVITLLLLSFRFPVLLIWLLLPFAVNLLLHLRNKNNTFSFLRSFPQLNILIRVTRQLAAHDLPFDSTGINDSLNKLKAFQRQFRRLSFGQTGNNEFEQIYYWLLEVLKALFLVEIHTFYSLISRLEQLRPDIHRIFKYTGSIDLAISVASLRAGPQPTCTPTLTPAARQLTITDGYHPLIDNCVANTLTINHRGILITGSNMSGKTTFLRTLGINSLLAQTLYTCFAAAYEAPVLRLYSSIRIDDNLLEGKSYYFEEVNVMKQLIDAAGSPTETPNSPGPALSALRNLYLLDEVFRGTNTVERIAAATAILSWLDRLGHFVIVSTHDLELADLLKSQYDLYHFEETLLGEELVFDHLLKPGPLLTRNAIRILEMLGYPAAIITEANATTTRLTASSSTSRSSPPPSPPR